MAVEYKKDVFVSGVGFCWFWYCGAVYDDSFNVVVIYKNLAFFLISRNNEYV